MLCLTYIYVLKYNFVVYKKIDVGVKLELWNTSYFLNGRVTVSPTMLIRLSHESFDVRSLCKAAARQS